MKTRVVKALNLKQEIVYIIQFKNWWWFFWENYKRYEWISTPSVPGYWRGSVIEFTDMETAKKIEAELKYIKEVL